MNIKCPFCKNVCIKVNYKLEKVITFKCHCSYKFFMSFHYYKNIMRTCIIRFIFHKEYFSFDIKKQKIYSWSKEEHYRMPNIRSIKESVLLKAIKKAIACRNFI